MNRPGRRRADEPASARRSPGAPGPLNARSLAWELLASNDPAPLRGLERAGRDLEPRERGLLRRLVGTELRRRGTLAALVRAFARGQPAPELVLHLRLGLVQLVFLDRIPEHAAVSETVDLVGRALGRGPAGYANAVLRSVLRARQPGASGDPRRDVVGREWHFEGPVFADPKEHPLEWAEDALSIPAPLYTRWRRRYGDALASELARHALGEPALSLRVVRGAQVDRAALARELGEAGASAVPSAHASILLVPTGEAEAALGSDAFRRGDLTVQGEAALRAAELVGAAAGERVLDLCAAPGGKSAVLAAAGATVVACDIEREKLQRARETIERLGQSQRVELVLAPKPADVPAGPFDAVLVDAPCSNTGVLAARPEARWRFSPGSLKSLTSLQAELLRTGAARVRPGGRLVWSTCSLEPEENDRLVQAFVEATPGWEIADSLRTLPAVPPGPVDGGWAARLVRSG